MSVDALLYSHCTVGSKDLHMGWDGVHCRFFLAGVGNKEDFWDFLCLNCLLVELILHIVHSVCR
jgi:hypothetical protein